VGWEEKAGKRFIAEGRRGTEVAEKREKEKADSSLALGITIWVGPEAGLKAAAVAAGG
jgi:hypothetical protein